MIAPYFCNLSEKHSSIMFLLVDVDEMTVSREVAYTIIIIIIIYLEVNQKYID